MDDQWQPITTTTHQDHVIAHVFGTTVLGYFVIDQVLHVLIDLEFIWTIYLDGQMVLLPYPVAVDELEVDSSTKTKLTNEIQNVLLSRVTNCELITTVPDIGELREVAIFSRNEERCFELHGADGTLKVETSLSTGTILVGIAR